MARVKKLLSCQAPGGPQAARLHSLAGLGKQAPESGPVDGFERRSPSRVDCRSQEPERTQLVSRASPREEDAHSLHQRVVCLQGRGALGAPQGDANLMGQATPAEDRNH